MHTQLHTADYDDSDDERGGNTKQRRTSTGRMGSRQTSVDGTGRRISSSMVGSKDVDTLREEMGLEPGMGAEEGKDNTRMLVVSFVLMVFVGLGNKVFQKLMTIPMHNYPNYLNLMTTFIYIPVSFAYIWPMYKNGTIDEAQWTMSKKP